MFRKKPTHIKSIKEAGSSNTPNGKNLTDTCTHNLFLFAFIFLGGEKWEDL